MAWRTNSTEHPYVPYPIQQKFMEQLYQTLEDGSVGLFESPTGTGKTISIICGALHWLEDFRHRAKEVGAVQATGLLDDDEPDWIQAHRTTSSATEPEPHPWLKRRSLVAAGARRIVQLHSLGAAATCRRGGTAGESPISGTAAAAAMASAGVRCGGIGSGGGNQQGEEEDEHFLLAPTSADGGGEGGAADTGSRRARALALLADDSSSGEESGSGGEVDDLRAALRVLRAPPAPPARTPQIFFASRTHSQLAQFIGELRRTGFASRLRIVSLASRRGLCVHEPVAALQAAGLINERCTELQERSKGGGSSKAQRTDGRAEGDGCPRAAACGSGACTAAARHADPDVGPGPASRGRKRSNLTAGGVGCPFLAPALESLEEFAGAVLEQPMDVEDLGRTGRRLGLCPYYGSRALVSEADIVALPYSALLCEETRGSLGLRLEGSVVIFDEAHNLVDAVTATHGSQVTLGQLQTAVRQLSAYFSRFQSRLSPSSARNVQLLLRIAASLERCVEQPQQQPQQQQPRAPATGSGGATAAGRGCSGAGVEVFHKYDFLVVTRLDHLNLFPLLSWVRESRLVMKVAGYDLATSPAGGAPAASATAVEAAVDVYDDSEGYGSGAALLPQGAGVAASSGGQRRGGGGGGSGFGARRASLFAFVSFLTALTQPNADGRIVVCRAAAAGDAADANASLRYTVLNAAAPFTSLVQSARSVVLASGTLSPVEGLVAQLLPNVPPQRVRHFSCGHVVPRDNLLALVAARGPTGLELDLRHSRRADPRVSEEVGRLLANICTAVPAGVVVFVPSFAYLDQLVEAWRRTDVWLGLTSRKHVFVEPRSACEVEAVLASYAAAIQRSAAGLKDTHAAAAVAGGTGPGLSARRPHGAMLLSVVGGKLSEGINFGDDLGRCVVVLGLPYPNPSDPELRERMKYLDDMANPAKNAQAPVESTVVSVRSASATEALGGHSGVGRSAACTTASPLSSAAAAAAAAASPAAARAAPPAGAGGCAVPPPHVAPPPRLTGRQYYEGLCTKAVNQCVGRVIRHARDYAAIVLVDARFMPRCDGGKGADGVRGSIASTLPDWIQQSLWPGTGDFAHLYGRLVGFFRRKAAAN